MQWSMQVHSVWLKSAEKPIPMHITHPDLAQIFSEKVRIIGKLIQQLQLLYKKVTTLPVT